MNNRIGLFLGSILLFILTLPSLAADVNLILDNSPGKLVIKNSGLLTVATLDSSGNINIEGNAALGHQTVASGIYSVALGYQSSASGPWSTAMGYGCTSSGTVSTAMGLATVASGYHSTAMGDQTTARGDRSVTIGGFYTNPYPNSLSIGSSNLNILLSAEGTCFIDPGNQGRLGIGTMEPQGMLHVVMSNGEGTPAYYAGTVIVAQQNSATNWSNVAITGGRTGWANLNFGDADNPQIGGVRYSNSADSMLFMINNSESMRILSNGNLGIGTTNPRGKLHVASQEGLSNLVVSSTSGWVGIGTTNPGETLEVVGNIKLGFSALGRTIQGADSAGAGTPVTIRSGSNTGGGYSAGNLNLTAGTSTSGSSFNGNIILNTSGAERMRVSYNSNVGIGISSPAATLDVYGTTKLGPSSAVFKTYYSDITVTPGNSTTVTIPGCTKILSGSLLLRSDGTPYKWYDYTYYDAVFYDNGNVVVGPNAGASDRYYRLFVFYQ